MRIAALALSLIAVLPFAATAFDGFHFSHKDWEVACDNTGTCRAAGYQREADIDRPVSVLLTRKAGEDAPVMAELSIHLEIETPAFAELYSGTQRLMTIRLHGSGMAEFSQSQARQLLAAIQGRLPIRLHADGETWTLSSEGANAVLLKMDEFQRRVGSASALIRPGKVRGKPLPPQSTPVIQAAATLTTPVRTLTPEDTHYYRLYGLLKQAANGQCYQAFADDEIKLDFKIHRLSDTRALAVSPCWMGAYNHGDLYVLMDSDLQQVLDVVDGDLTGYANGVLSSTHKDRGMGDCWSTKEYVWDGQKFVLSLEQTTGLCRGFPGGAWPLPTFVSEVRR